MHVSFFIAFTHKLLVMRSNSSKTILKKKTANSLKKNFSSQEPIFLSSESNFFNKILKIQFEIGSILDLVLEKAGNAVATQQSHRLDATAMPCSDITLCTSLSSTVSQSTPYFRASKRPKKLHMGASILYPNPMRNRAPNLLAKSFKTIFLAQEPIFLS